MVRYTASQSSDGMAGVEGSVSATVCHITAWAMAPGTGSIHAETQPGQDVASFTAVVLKAARGLEMTQAQLVRRLVLGGLHATVTPFVEITQPTTVDELLRSPAAINGMAAPAMPMERDVMAHGIGPAGDQAQRDMLRVNAYSGRHSTEQSGSQRGSGRHRSAQSGGGDYQQARTQRQPWQENDRCTFCGRWCDGNRNCPAYTKRCFGCHQLGHFIAQCRSSRR